MVEKYLSVYSDSSEESPRVETVDDTVSRAEQETAPAGISSPVFRVLLLAGASSGRANVGVDFPSASVCNSEARTY